MVKRAGCGRRAGQATRLTEHRGSEFAHVAVARNRVNSEPTTHGLHAYVHSLPPSRARSMRDRTTRNAIGVL